MLQDSLRLLLDLAEGIETDHHVGLMVPWANTSVERELTDIIEALGLLGAQTVVLATPYPIPTGEQEEAQFAANGIGVRAAFHLDQADRYDTIPSSRIIELVDNIGAGDLAAADALVLSCTGWLTLEPLQVLQQRLGKPVLSSNLSMAISAAARCAGVE